MHSGLSIGRPLTRYAAAVAFLWVTALSTALADPPQTVAPAKVSSKQGSEGGPASSKPVDVKEEFLLPGQGSSGAPGIDIPPPQGTQPNQRMDPRARKKLMEEADRRRNWVFDDKNSGGPGGKSKGAAADRKKESEPKPVEFESSRQRSLMEKRVAGEDENSKKEQANREDRQAKDRKRSDPSKQNQGEADSDPDADLKDDKESLRNSKAGIDRDNRPFQQAVFSDPFTAGRAEPEANARTAFGSGANASGSPRSGSDPVSPRVQADRMESILNRSGTPATSRSESGLAGDFGGSRPNHAVQFNDLLVGSDSGGGKPGLLDSAKAPAASKAFGSGPGSVFGGVGSGPSPSSLPGSSFTAPSAARPSAPLVKPQPGVLPFPSRTF